MTAFASMYGPVVCDGNCVIIIIWLSANLTCKHFSNFYKHTMFRFLFIFFVENGGCATLKILWFGIL